jgi:hypothetical protein
MSEKEKEKHVKGGWWLVACGLWLSNCTRLIICARCECHRGTKYKPNMIYLN